MAGVGDELLAGGVDLAFGVEAGFQFGLALWAADQFAVDQDDGDGDEEPDEEAGDVADLA